MGRQAYFIDGLYVEHYPGKNSGHPLLFVPGSWGGSWMFENYLTYLSNGEWDCYALNLRGHYKSEPCELRETTQWDYMRDVITVAQTLPAPPVVIGFGMGAQLVQMAFSQKLAAVGAVFISAKRAVYNPEDTPDHVLNLPKMLVGVPLKDVPDMSPKALAAFNQHLVEQAEPLSCFLTLLRGELDLSYVALRAPYLVLNGEKDTEITRADGEELAKIYEGQGTLEIIPDASHEGILVGFYWRNAANALNYWLTGQHFHTRKGG